MALMYLLSVGAPLAGLLAILEAGKRVVPPRSVGGTWQVEEPAALAAACGGTVRPAAVRLHVSQSGPRAEAGFGDGALGTIAVEVRGDTVLASGPGTPVPGCGVRGLRLRARLEGEHRMVGTLRFTGCAGCRPVPFAAVRSATGEGER